ncbi:MAG TPA: carcinine hydrolase/isopenicillin-N N-acyltransferase family protein [Saprospiraceae bacterium]|nr:carcinine hydrolase/isopenicillin-N N-acyltransferase family protein [Saprospiraceae bacterium]
MCDTIAILGKNTSTGFSMFAKNSDREPNEAQVVIRIPSMEHESDMVKCTYISIPQVRQTYEVILSKPFHIWGAEMGCNEKGVAIGNEAVFSNFNKAKTNTGLSGMDMVRLALERANNAEKAVDLIFEWVAEYGQDVCGGFQDKNFFYDNSFLIIDPQTAWKVETAGKFAAAIQIQSWDSISNGYTIEYDFDRVNRVFEKWIKSEKPKSGFSFKKNFSDSIMSHFTRQHTRRACSLNYLETAAPEVALKDLAMIMSSHEEGFSYSGGTPRSLCMHASGIFCPHQTTGSMIIEWRGEKTPLVWATGSSHPCLSEYKPIAFGGTGSRFTENENDGLMYWVLHEYGYRSMILENDESWLQFIEEKKEIKTDILI